MSIGRIGTRAVIVCLGVFASMALMAAPSWAAKGGNSANAALCHGGYAGVLLAQDGSAFKNAGACTSYGAKGGQIAGVNVTAQPAVAGSLQEFRASGFGLAPGTEVQPGATLTPPNYAYLGGVTVDAGGEFNFGQAAFPCELFGETVTALFVKATTAAGTVFTREFPLPSGC